MTGKRLLAGLAVALGAALACSWALAPPARTRLAPPHDPRLVRGALHVHTTRSDGAGTPEQVAAAAGRAGLHFVVLTDHGDATRKPDPPRYVGQVLLVDGVEISTSGGHYVAIGLPQAPYRLAGEPRDVVADVARLGGFGMAAHPDSPKPELSWRDWQAPFDGLEWLNADSAWRDERRPALARALLSYWLRAPETIVSLFDRPERTLARWDALSRRRPVVGLAGHDAHARIGSRGDWEPADGGRTLRLPSYESAFRAFSVSLLLSRELPAGDAGAGASAIVDALRAGRAATVIDALAGPGHVDFTASNGASTAVTGGDLSGGTVNLAARVSAAVEGVELRLVKDGAVAARSATGTLAFVHDATQAAAVYRVEAAWPGAPGTPPVPWIVTNAIRVGFSPARPAPSLLPPARWARPVPVQPWRIEKHAASAATLTPAILSPSDTAWKFEWTLAAGRPAGQYAAAAVPVAPGFLRDADRVSFVGRASGPMRLSVQLRTSASGRRWQRSVYLSAVPAEQSVAFREMTPADPDHSAPLDAAAVDAILFVVDTVNAVPGSSGHAWISQVRAEGP